MLEQIFADIRFLPHRGTKPSTPRKTSFLGVGGAPSSEHVLSKVRKQWRECRMMSRINTSVRAEKQISDRNGNTSKQTKKSGAGFAKQHSACQTASVRSAKSAPENNHKEVFRQRRNILRIPFKVCACPQAPA